jgi:hypothetical protein
MAAPEEYPLSNTLLRRCARTALATGSSSSRRRRGAITAADLTRDARQAAKPPNRCPLNDLYFELRP